MDFIHTDVWVSMGEPKEAWQERIDLLKDYRVTPELMAAAENPQVKFMHCLPAHRGEEISEDMLDDPRAVVWDEAENRLHAQKALIEFLLFELQKK